MHGDSTATIEQRSAAKSSAALSSLLAALAITLLKCITGVLTGSLGMISEAAHSAVDLIASTITLFAVRVSDRPADEDHNYGHGKLESISAGIETLIMIGSTIWIARAAIERIVHHRHLDLHWSIWPFVVLLLSMAVDFTRARALHRVAAEQSSDALAADAMHFGTDLWSSAAVFLGLLTTFLGERYGISALEYADPIAALAVAIIIVRVTWKLAVHTVNALTDATPPEASAAIRSDLLGTDGVLAVDRVRVRRSGSDHFVDLTLSMPRNLTFQRSEQITFAATEAVRKRLPGADVVIHSVPTATLDESVFDRVRAVASRWNLAIHDVSVQQYDDALHVEQHLEVPETMTLQQAHEIATKLETGMREEVPEIATILTHIESEPTTIAQSAQFSAAENLSKQLRETALEFPEILDVHDILVVRGHGGAATSVQVNCHCTLPDALPMSRVHEIITDFESEFRLKHPQVARVLIHPEPATDNKR